MEYSRHLARRNTKIFKLPPLVEAGGGEDRLQGLPQAFPLDAGLQPARYAEEGEGRVRQIVGFPSLIFERQPNVRAESRLQSIEALRCHADNLEPASASALHPPAQDIRTASEAALPEAVAEQGYQVPPHPVVSIERSAKRR